MRCLGWFRQEEAVPSETLQFGAPVPASESVSQEGPRPLGREAEKWGSSPGGGGR